MANPLYDALIAPHAQNSAPFLIQDSGAVLTFAAFTRRAAQMAHAITGAGVRPGDRIVVQTEKSADVVALYAGAVQAGAVYLPLNTAYTLQEVSYFITDAAPALIVCDPQNAAEIEPLATAVGATVMTLGPAADGTLSRAADAAQDNFETVSRNPDDLAGLLYTSGTTGRSKGAMMSQRNLLSNAAALTDLWQITSRDRLIHALPIFHTHGLFVALNTALLAGAAIRLMQRFDTAAVIEALPTCTLMMGVPTFYTRLLGDVNFDRSRCANMRLFISGSAPLLSETHTAFSARTGHQILERYGMTETNMITSNPYEGARLPGTVGFALPGVEVRVTRDGAPVAAGEIGMVEVRGPNVFQGYWNMPEKTREELRDNGFFITGDLGVMDETCRLSIVGRQKDLIITGGYNVYPKEIEDILNQCEGVVESAVFGIPDKDFGEAIVAAIVGHPDQVALEDGLAQGLARYKHPKKFLFLDALPRNAMGKVQKNVLRETHS